jgi:hypothetical protein
MLPNKGGGAPKGAGVDTAVAHKRSAACVALSRRALLLGRRARLPALYRGSRQRPLGPRLSPVPRFMAAPGCDSVRHPGSELLADRRRGRPGGFPNRPNAVCETAPRHRARSTFRIASGKRPWMSERCLCTKSATIVKSGRRLGNCALIQRRFLRCRALWSG